MLIKSKLKIESVGMFAAFVFYAIAGIIQIIILAMNSFNLIHVGLIGILSLVAAYGLFNKRRWSLWVVIALFFIATTFSAFMLYYAFGTDLALDVSVTAYLILTWIFTVYVAARRSVLEG